MGRYRGASLGVVWSFLAPLLMLSIYAFVFGEIFQSKWSGTVVESTVGFAVVLFSGLITFTIFAEGVTKSPSMIASVPNYVKKVVFPLEILPIVSLVSSLIHFVISLVLLLFVLWWGVGIKPTLNWLLLPVVLAPLLALTLAITYLLASLGVFIRDIGHITGVAVNSLMFLSPIFFPTAAVPEKWRWLLLMNPMTSPVEGVRDVLIFGRSVNWESIAMHFSFAMLLLFACFAWFQHSRRGFADVL
jgi:lipopolysaccharide transport system permease protein